MKKEVLSESIRSIQLPFDWIDVLAVPIATCIMETQPFAVVLLFMALLVTGNSASVPLDAVSITLLLLGLHWWALLVKYLVQRGVNEKLEGALQFLGLLLALALTIVTHMALLNNVLVLLLVTVLVIWFWVRDKRRAWIEPSEEQLLFSFKLCFVVLLTVLLVTIPVNSDIAGPTLATIAVALPLFFVSGLIALSFVRLSHTRHEYRRDAFGTRLDHTRAWSLFLALTWSMLIIATILLEIFSFQPLLTLFTPFINAIEQVVAAIAQLFTQKPPKHVHHRLIPTPKPVAPSHSVPLNLSLNLPIIIIIVVVSIVILVVAFLMLVWFLFTLRGTLFGRMKGREGEREMLDVRSILNERRRRKRQRKPAFRLEPLDPNSVRARYRDLLLATAHRRGDIQRLPHETPGEYQQRLLSVVATIPNKEGEPANTAIVTELTEAYVLERYGRKKAEQVQVGYFKRCVSYLVKRIRHIKI